ncbi:TonB-dependent receptor [Thiopseudomonas alkaliphila]|uniref:TonB-dependent receptor n=1 Tax=Thiopseudomonas alkaliphila TaxID=1697053 RepID=UPI00069E318A|nr:TonB-dependent receptor [Thiopseudomonas alkaliphila]AKX55336.1 TonB-dependent receptor [Thiopseudomonas alkaliphila]
MQRPSPTSLTLLAVSISLSTHALASDPVLQLPTTVVSASPLASSPNAMTSAAEVLTTEDLLLQRKATLGETIEQLPGVRGSSFGSGASRPVIRGMDGARVKVLSNGVSSLDASTLSPDHAVTLEPMLSQQIEVLKGPATLLYGGGAIGGVVNVLDSKIPEYLPENGHAVDLEWQANSVAKSNTAAAGATLGMGPFALRVEGLKRNANAYRLAGHEDGSRAKKQTGSYNDTDSASLGLSWITDTGYTGIAYSRQANTYGLLAHEHGHCHTHGQGSSLHWHCGSHGHGHGHGHDEHDEHGVPYIDMVQKRWDLRSDYEQPFAGIEQLRFRASHSDYQHDEIEGHEVSTAFDSRAWDSRLELTHEPLWGWKGVFGGQFSRRNFKASGEEAYVPKTLTKNHALFLLEEYQWQNWRYELGLRHEWQSIDAKSQQPDRSHQGTSFSLGSVWQFHPDYNAAISWSRSQRLPVAEELYAFGPHAASRTVEIGNPKLNKETSHNIELSVKKINGPLTFHLTAYQNRINDYIHGADTGERPGSGYRVLEYRQQDAVFRGLEGQARYQLARGLAVSVQGDHVRGKLRNKQGNLARIPADRLGIKVEQQFAHNIQASAELFRVQQQNRLADFESKTSGYNLLGAGINYQGALNAQSNYQLYLRGDNLLNVKAREHTSFIKDRVQLPGRNLTVGVKVTL